MPTPDIVEAPVTGPLHFGGRFSVMYYWLDDCTEANAWRKAGLAA